MKLLSNCVTEVAPYAYYEVEESDEAKHQIIEPNSTASDTRNTQYPDL